jgi:hypothetical protein
MNRSNRTIGIGAAEIALTVTTGHAQAPRGERAGGPPAAGANYKESGSPGDTANFVYGTGF